LTDYVKSGKPLLLLLDPMPAFNLQLAPNEIAQAGMMLPGAAPPTSTKANLRPMLDALGITWQTNRIVWDNYNPQPQLKSLPKEFVFVGKGFNQKEPVTAGLQEMVLLYPGLLKPRSEGPKFTPLLEAGPDSGTVRWEDLVQQSLFGTAIDQNVKHAPEEAPHVLAARITGSANAIAIADVDLMGEQFFELRRRGIE